MSQDSKKKRHRVGFITLRDTNFEPEQKLLIAVIRRAIQDYVFSIDDDIRDQARRWLRGQITTPQLTFDQCCSGLDVEQEFLLEEIRRLGGEYEDFLKEKREAKEKKEGLYLGNGRKTRIDLASLTFEESSSSFYC